MCKDALCEAYPRGRSVVLSRAILRICEGKQAPHLDLAAAQIGARSRAFIPILDTIPGRASLRQSADDRRSDAAVCGSEVIRRRYLKRYKFAPLQQISPNLAHAVIAAEDGRFTRHHGIDWAEVEKVAQESSETGSIRRGASTITQQLVKNLFFTTHRNPVRKAFEYTLAPLRMHLGKRRVLELYLNVVEWGPGVYGAEAAADTITIQHRRSSIASKLRDSLHAARAMPA